MISLSHFNIHSSISLEADALFFLNKSILPKEKLGVLVDVSGNTICKLEYGGILFEGGYGILHKCKRKDVHAIVKKPKGDIYLGGEALVQWLAHSTLKKKGIEGAIPEIFDIFVSGDHICFSMEYISGQFPYHLLAEVANPEKVFLQILAQACILIYHLEKELSLDHRDLKANNLYIRHQPIEYRIEAPGGKRFCVAAPFQVVILDFGFACIGEDGMTKINLAKKILSDRDPCPKEGRDLFHLLTSFWSIPSIRDKMNQGFREQIDKMLATPKKNYSKITQKFKETDWVYLLTSDPAFTFPTLSPLYLLEQISKMSSSVVVS
jgi:serine/threonine protein kinase